MTSQLFPQFLFLPEQAPALMIPLGQSSDSPHLANERIRRTNLMKGKVCSHLLLYETPG